MSLSRLREAGTVFQMTVRKFSKQFWLKASASIKAAAYTGDTKSVCGGNIKAVGPIKKLTSPLQSVTREILYNRYEQLGRWVQQFYLPYSKHNSINDAKLKHMESLSKMDDLDSEQTIEELSKVITEMTSCKTPDSDSIPADLFH